MSDALKIRIQMNILYELLFSIVYKLNLESNKFKNVPSGDETRGLGIS